MSDMLSTTNIIPEKPFKLTLPTNGGVSYILLGASRSGKTTLMKYLIDHYANKQLLFFTSFNDHADIYKDIPKRTMIMSEFYPSIIKDFYVLNHNCSNKYKALFAYDDAIGNKLKNDAQITKLLTIYRNAHMSSLFSAQSPTLVSPAGRSNGNFIFLFKLNASKEIELTVKDFLTAHLPTHMRMTEKIQWYNWATADHHFIVIDNINNTICRCRLTDAQIADKG
jgi:hypothetical protein